jgi:2-octaprenyl-6-methoxyphenol hydroxylase
VKRGRVRPSDACDILIAGGGPVGAAVALGLRGVGLDVALVEPEARPAAAFRPIALSHGSRQILEGLGLFGRFTATPIETIHVSQAGGFGRTVIRREDHGVPALGYVCDASALAATLAEATSAQRVAGHVVGWRAESEAIRVAVDAAGSGGREIAAQLLVLADGGQIAGDDLAMRDYGQTAIVARVRTEIVRRGTAWERFTADGPLALLPDGDALALVWTVRTGEAARLLEASGERFLASLGARFGRRLGRFIDAGPRAGVPLRLVFRRSSVVAPRTVAVGNAAQTLHPVAGQGLNLGLRDAAELAALIRRTAPVALGGDDFLAAYGARRRVDRLAAIGVTNFLAGIFGNPSPGLRAARGLGLVALDLVPPARRLFARRMMLGLRGAP